MYLRLVFRLSLTLPVTAGKFLRLLPGLSGRSDCCRSDSGLGIKEMDTTVEMDLPDAQVNIRRDSFMNKAR